MTFQLLSTSFFDCGEMSLDGLFVFFFRGYPPEREREKEREVDYLITSGAISIFFKIFIFIHYSIYFWG